MTIRLGILTTHPIQYQVPWFRALSATPGIDLTVFFCMIPDAQQQGDGFGVAFQWNVPLTDGYRWRLLKNVSRSPSVTSFSGCDTPEIAEVVRDGNFDAFIVNGWVAKSCIQLLRACNRYRVPCIVRGESNSLRPRAWWKRLMHRVLLRRYAAFLYIGAANRRFYRDNGVPERKLFFAPYCVENDRFASAAASFRKQRDDLRREMGIPADAVVFLFSGKFVAKKRPEDCIEAIRKAVAMRVSRKQSRPMHLLMTGSGDLLTDCRRLAEQDNLPVSFTGFLNQAEMPRAYAASDCLILPSDDGETWGLVVNEAMASGLPAIVSDRVGCHPDLVTPGETGHIVALRDTAAIADLMVRLADSPETLDHLSASARERVSHYNYAAAAAATIAAINSVRKPPETMPS